jgi:putative ABC transport system permease protein
MSALKNLRVAARILLRAPGIAFSIILILALGVGANSALFGVVNGLVLRPVSYPQPETLVFVWSNDPQGARTTTSPANFLDWRAGSRTLADFAGWVITSMTISGRDRPRQVAGAAVTANFFQTLGVKPLFGRTFLPGEDGLDGGPAAAKSVIVSYRYWQEDLGADPDVIGRTLSLNFEPYTIVGVMPRDFQFWWRAHDVWTPISMDVHNRDNSYLTVVARRKSSLSTAAAEMNVVSRSLAAAYPNTNQGWTVRVEDFRERLLSRTFRNRLWLLTGAVGLLLLIACTNVANLLLTRSAAREREMAVRMALGATGGRIAAQLFTESGILSAAGGALGLAIAWVLIRAAPKFVPSNVIPTPIELNAAVTLFTLALSAATAMLCGLAPALAATRSDIQKTLKDLGRGSTAGRNRQRFRQTMVAVETGLALVLLTCGGVMMEGLRSLDHGDAGFDPNNVLTLRLFLPLAKYDSEAALRFRRTSLQRLAALPGVNSVAAATTLPLINNMEVPFDVEGAPPRGIGQEFTAPYAAVTPDFFQTLKIPLKRGRYFTEGDDERAPAVAIVNEALVARYLGSGDPLGQRIVVSKPVLGHDEYAPPQKLQIVGVVGNVKMRATDPELKPVLYVPQPQGNWSTGVWFAARTNLDPPSLASAVRGVFMSLDRDQPIEQLGTLEQLLDSQLAQPRFQTGLMAAFASLALLLAAIGVYGINAYAVAQRRSEIGLRMALGAGPATVVLEIVARGMIPAALGMAAGLGGAIAAASLLRTVLVGAGAFNPFAFVAAALVLVVVSAAACYIPARRAARIDPAIALRAD